MPRYGHGSNFVAHTATLEVKLSSRTLKDIIEEQLVSLSPSGNAIFQKLDVVEYSNTNRHTRPEPTFEKSRFQMEKSEQVALL